MPVTLTTSQAAAAAKPATEPTILIDLVTASAEQYHFATQPCSWSGIMYQARLTSVSDLQTGVGGLPYDLPSIKSLTIELANDDQWFSAFRPSWIRGQPLTYKEVFLDVDSAAVRQFDFRVTAQSLPSEQRFRIEAEDILAPVRRKLIPTNDVLITTSLYPNLSFGAVGANLPVPFLFGRTYCPIYFVDQSSDASKVYVACVGSAYFTNCGTVVDWFDGGLSRLADGSAAVGSDGVPLYPNDGNSTFPWSVRYAVRNLTRDDGSTFSFPVTEIVTHPSIADGGGRRFADLTWDHGSSAWTTPDEVLIEMFRNCFEGAHLTPTLINSDSLLTAHSFYTANSIYFDGALIEQRGFEDWLAQWQHDSLTRLTFRDQIYLTPCQSRTAVASFTDANILHGQFAYADVPLQSELSRRTLYFKERTNDADYGQGDGAQGNDARGGSFTRWDVGSGIEVKPSSPFIGRRSVASRVVQYWAKQAAIGQRTYRLGSTAKTISVEDGDLVTLTASFFGVNSQPCEVLGTTRQDGIYTHTLMETDASVWSASIGADPDFGFFYQRVAYSGASYALGNGLYPPLIAVSSHQLGRTPTSLIPWAPFNLIQSTLVNTSTTNNSQFVTVNQYIFQGPVNAQTALFGWYLYV